MEHNPPLAKVNEILSQLYQDVNAKHISLEARQQLGIQDETFVYGEMTFDAFPKILNIAKPQAGETFYDLGCGAGKAVFSAATTFDFRKVVGVELLEPLYKVCAQQLDRFNKSTGMQRLFPGRKFNIEFRMGDLFFTNIKEANIIYVNATCFIGDAWQHLLNKLKEASIGARIILNTKHIYDEEFKQLHTSLFPMSWGDCTINIYEKIA